MRVRGFRYTCADERFALQDESELFADKLNEPVEQAESAIFRRGNLLEKPLLEAASDELGSGVLYA
jgi:hypothetical protein